MNSDLSELPAFLKDTFLPCIREHGILSHCLEHIIFTPEILGILLLILYWVCVYAYKHIKKRRSINDLHPYFTKDDVKQLLSLYIPAKAQSVLSSKSGKPKRAQPERLLKLLKRDFLTNRNYRFCLILGDTGLGKTTFLVRFYTWYSSQIYVLRRKYRVKLVLFDFNNTDALEIVRSIEDKANSILLLDGFDEDVKASNDFKSRLRQIEKVCSDFRKIIITCRTQFFSSLSEEPTITTIRETDPLIKGFEKYFKVYMSPFSEVESKRYIRRKFSFFKRGYSRNTLINRRKALVVFRKIKKLLVRPLLLANIEHLLDAEDSKYTFELYQKLIMNWLEREFGVVKDPRYPTKIFKLSTELAFNMWNNRSSRNGLFISKTEIISFVEKSNVNINDFHLRTRSLLNRNDTHYKFSHKSFFDFFLANHAFTHPEGTDTSLLFKDFNVAGQFYHEMVNHSIFDSSDFDATVEFEGNSNLKTSTKYLKIKSLIVHNYANRSINSIKNLVNLLYLDISLQSSKNIFFCNNLNQIKIIDISFSNPSIDFELLGIPSLEVIHGGLNLLESLKRHKGRLLIKKVYIILPQKKLPFEIAKLTKKIDPILNNYKNFDIYFKKGIKRKLNIKLNNLRLIKGDYDATQFAWAKQNNLDKKIILVNNLNEDYIKEYLDDLARLLN